MKLYMLAVSIGLAMPAAPITATMTCTEGITGESWITVSGAVYGGFNNGLGCGLVFNLYGPNTMHMRAAGLGGPDGDGILNGFRLAGTGVGVITSLNAIFDLDPSGYASGYFSVERLIAEVPRFERLEILHIDAFGTYAISQGMFFSQRTRIVSLTLDTEPNAVQAPEPSAVVGTALGLMGAAFLRRRATVAG